MNAVGFKEFLTGHPLEPVWLAPRRTRRTASTNVVKQLKVVMEVAKPRSLKCK